MKIGYIGLGKMGKNMVLRMLEQGVEVVAWNRSEGPMREVASAGATTVASVEELVSTLGEKRIVWMMLPSGDVTGDMVNKLSELLSSGDILIDGANSFFKDTIKRSKVLEAKGIKYIDAGVSGGPAGARNGACCMVGGSKELFTELEDIFKAISAPNAYQHFEGIGAGHFVKMVHNGIEYGMMQAIGEGFNVMKQSEFNLNLTDVSRIYNNQSVIESRLVGWLENAYKEHTAELEGVSGSIDNNGEGKWTVEIAEEMGLETKVIKDSYEFRVNSGGNPSYTGKVVSALRNQFGGHDVSEK